MRNASENADEMIKELTRDYNRARQSQITVELLDIVSGVEASKG
jgi:F-type H+-transporting ATPase subunit gamma